MALLPTIKRFTVAEFPDQQSWIRRLFQPLNQFIQTVVNALDHSLTFGDNFNAQVMVFSIKTNAALTAGTTVSSDKLPDYSTFVQTARVARDTAKLRSQAIGLIPLRVQKAESVDIPFYGVSLVWQNTNEGQVELLGATFLEADTRYEITALAIGG